MPCWRWRSAIASRRCQFFCLGRPDDKAKHDASGELDPHLFNLAPEKHPRTSEKAMTSSNWEDYSAADLEPQQARAPRRQALNAKHILAAVGAEIAARDKRIASLEHELKELREKIEAMERGGKPRQVVPFDKSSMIA
jgi:hypothetical protein